MNDEFNGDLPSEVARAGARPRSRPKRAHKPFGGRRQLANVVKVRFTTSFVTHDYDAQLLDLERGDAVIVETSKGPAMAVVASEIMRQVVAIGTLKKVLRLASGEDQRREEGNRAREEEAFRFCLERVRERNLDMKLIQVQYIHDGSKAVFYFSAEGRVDFRDLVRDLANRFRTRIEMRQIGVRDGARMVGGIGSCGRELCCSTFLSQFAPVSIRMAKDQGLTLNPKKVSGMCGRLMCCLVYEQQIYRKTLKRLPRSGKTVETPRGLGTIRNVDVVQEKVEVLLDDGQFEAFPVRDVVVLSPRELERRRGGGPAEPAPVPVHNLGAALSELAAEEGQYLWEDEPAEGEAGSGAEPGAEAAVDGQEAATDGEEAAADGEEGGGRARRRRGRRRRGAGGERQASGEASEQAVASEATVADSQSPPTESPAGERERRSRRRRRGSKPVAAEGTSPEASPRAADGVESAPEDPARRSRRRRRTGRAPDASNERQEPSSPPGSAEPGDAANEGEASARRRRTRRRRPGGRKDDGGQGGEGGGGGGESSD